MSAQILTLELSHLLALPEAELVRKGMLALIEKELRLAEQEIAAIRERYDVFSKEALYQAIQAGQVADIRRGKITSSGRIKTHINVRFVIASRSTAKPLRVSPAKQRLLRRKGARLAMTIYLRSQHDK